MKQSGLKRAIALFMQIGLLLSIGSSVGCAEQSVMDQISYEVKFFLAPDKVLTENHHGTSIGWVTEDSIIAQDKTVAYICGTDDIDPYMPLQRVIGVIELFEEADNETD